VPVIRDAWCVVFTVSPANDFCCALTAGGLVDVDVYTYEACSAVAYQSDFRNDGAKGWVFVGATAGTTTCGSDVILGGYNVLDKTDQAQRLVDLPMHTSLTVDFTWVMVRLSIACRLLLAGALSCSEPLSSPHRFRALRGRLRRNASPTATLFVCKHFVCGARCSWVLLAPFVALLG
jgi:hypothetical protein